MSDIYVFSPDDDDYTTMGLACALVPTECVFREQANGESAVEMKHPLDEFGRYMALQKGNILTVPVPVRTTPEIQNGSIVTTVWTYTVKSNAQASNKLRTMYNKVTGGKAMKVIPGGDKVTVVEKIRTEDGTEIDYDARWKVKTRYGTGWMQAFALEEEQIHQIDDNSQSIEEVQSPWNVAPQLFRIYEVEKNINSISVKARHISYDLLYNLTKRTVYSVLPHNLTTILNSIMNNLYTPHDFHAYTNVANTYAGVMYRGRNPIDCFLNQDDGVCKIFDVSMIRDNYDLYFLHDPGLNRGVRIQYGKNMTGVTFTSNDENVATRIVPVGKQPKTGGTTILYLSDNENQSYIDSPNINSYPVVHTSYVECDNCEVGQEEPGGGKLTVAQARARMREQVQKMYSEQHVDEPEISMKVEFINLGDTEEYAQFKDLEKCFLYDYVIVQHPYIDIDVTARIVSIDWDCLLDRMKSVEIGQVGKTLANTGITSWQIPSGISGSKIASETIGSSVLKDSIITARHIQTETVNAKTIAAQEIATLFIDAITAHVKSLTASTIITDEFSASMANIVTAYMESASVTSLDVVNLKASIMDAIAAHIDSLDATTIETDELYAQLAKVAVAQINTANIEDANIEWANITNLYAGVIDAIVASVEIGDFDFATIQKMVADAMVIRQATANTVAIDNLLVTSANMLNATIGELVLKGNDSKYYVVNIDSSGNIAATETDVSQAEIDSGETTTGHHIVDTNMNVAALNATNLSAQSAAIGQIVTASLSAEKITAGQALLASATIPALYSTSIQAIGNDLDLSANQSIRLLVSDEVSGAMADATPAVLRIDSSRGNLFKQNNVSTVLTVTIHYGAQIITTYSGLVSTFGSGSTLQWEYKLYNSDTWNTILSTDSRLTDHGFQFTLSPSDVDTKITFQCKLVLPSS